jgi:type III secretion protein T
MDDIAAIFQLASSVEHLFLTIALCSIRVYACFGVLPATADEFLPGAARNAVIVLLGFYIAFGLPHDAAHSLSGMQYLAFAIKELLIGLLLGFAASTVFWVAESAGAMIDMQAGYNNVQLQNPLRGEQSTPVSALMVQLMVALFYALGGMMVLVGVLMESFQVWPVMSALPPLPDLSDLPFLQQVDRMMAMVVKFAAPVVLVLVLIDVGTGLITRAADKLEPQSLSQPIKGAVTMLMLALLATVLLTQVRHFLLPVDLIERLTTLLPKR